MLGNEDDRVTLILVRAERPGGHDFTGLETERFAPVVQPGDEGAVTQHHAGHMKVGHQGADIGSGRVHGVPLAVIG